MALSPARYRCHTHGRLFSTGSQRIVSGALFTARRAVCVMLGSAEASQQTGSGRFFVGLRGLRLTDSAADSD